ncbi:MAG: family 20 glycosylhydrolase, partial [bacterium]
ATLRPATGFTLPVRAARDGAAPAGGILLTSAGAPAGDEAYAVEVAPAGVTLRAGTPAGFLHAGTTLRQMLPPAIESATPSAGPWTVPGVRIEDRPRYPWRGFLLDCGRHFMSVALVKRVVDVLAFYKFNRLHWHLTEDQGWRIEIARFPQLTAVGAWRGVAGGKESAARHG